MNNFRRASALILAATLFTSVGCRFAAHGQNIDGVRLLEQGQPQAAYQRFQQAIAQDPANADGYYNLAATLHRTGKQNNDQNMLLQAEQLYNQCLDRNPDHVECHRGLAVLLAQTNRNEQSLALLQRWAARSPQLSEPKVELARLLVERGDFVTAEQQLQFAIQQDYRNPRALAALGALKERQGDARSALASYERAYQLDRNFPRLAGHIQNLRQQVPAASAPIAPPGSAFPTPGYPTQQIANTPRNNPRY